MSDVAYNPRFGSWSGTPSSSTRDAQLLAELRSWALVAAGSLAVAGVFAFLLALSRIPGIESFASWPLGFFSKGLVIHVVFSLVIWFLAVFALLASLAAREICKGDMKLAFLGRIGLALVSMSFPMLFLPAFHATTTATLNNYVPVIIHPVYYLGLAFFALGALMPVLRLFANALPRLKALDAFPFAMTMGGIAYCVALFSFASGLAGVWGQEPSRSMHEHLFWGGGHVLQFLYCILMLTCWFILARQSLGEVIVDADIFKLAIGLIGIFSLAALIFCLAFPAFSVLQTEAFRRLQFVLAFPSLLVGVGGLVTVLRYRRTRTLPWRDPAFIALAVSPVVFGVGGLMGLLITGSDTRTPAHYHGVIAGVHVACMGVMLRFVLPALERNIAATIRTRLHVACFGAGQLLASIGLFVAGGYGAPRKTPSGAVDLTDGAAVGMVLHGVGALVAVIGGILFVVTILKALLAPKSELGCQTIGLQTTARVSREKPA